jgi:hypothetical protein
VQPRRAADLLDGTFRWLKLDETARTFRALEGFSRAAGPRIRAHARAERMRGGILYVRVASAAWSHELSALKAQLLAKLQRTPGCEDIRDLRFNVGPLDEVPGWPGAAPPQTEVEPAVRAADPELTRAIGGVPDTELRESLSRLFARSGPRRRP